MGKKRERQKILYTEDTIIDIVTERLSHIPAVEVYNTISNYFNELYKTLSTSNNHLEIRLKYFGTFVYCVNNTDKTDFNKNKKIQAGIKEKFRDDLKKKRLHIGKFPNRDILKLRQGHTWKETEEIQNKHFSKLKKKKDAGL